MKIILQKLILLLIILFMCHNPALCAESSDTSSLKFGSDSDVFNKGFEGQEPVTDTTLQKTIQMLKERSLSSKQKKLRNEVQPLSPSSDYEHLKNFALSQSPEDELSQTLTVLIPMTAYNEDGIKIPPGYYKLSCRKVAKNEYILDLSQGTKRILSVNAKQTQQDLEQESISFCNAEIISDDRIRLVYGSMDLNLVGYLYFN